MYEKLRESILNLYETVSGERKTMKEIAERFAKMRFYDEDNSVYTERDICEIINNR